MQSLFMDFFSLNLFKCLSKKNITGSTKTDQQVTVLAAKSYNLKLDTQTHMVEEENWFPEMFLSPVFMHY